MKAIVYDKYGPPDVLERREIERPVVTDDGVLVRVHATSVNPVDWHTMTGTPYLVRMQAGLVKPKREVLGIDFAGTVEAVGRSVKQFQPGDEVFGAGNGAFAEYVCVREERAVVLKPANLTFEQAAAVAVAALSALQGLLDKGQIQSGQKVLINGASGGVGTFAVQIAKSFGAEVTGVCSTPKLDMVCSIGADHVVDYTREDFTRSGQHYDLIYDAVGNRSVSAYKRALSPQGKCVIAGFTSLPRLLEQMILGPRLSKAGGKQIIGQGMASTSQENLLVIKELLETGKVVPVIDKLYPLSKTAEAIGYLEKGHAAGKVVITVEHR